MHYKEEILSCRVNEFGTLFFQYLIVIGITWNSAKKFRTNRHELLHPCKRLEFSDTEKIIHKIGMTK